MSELSALAERVAAQARPHEQVEAFVSRSRRFNVRAYEGEVESLTSAESAGIGIRVVVDGPGGRRQGFAHAGSLDEGIIAETLADARDNAAFAEPDEWLGLAEPDGVEPVELELFSPELLRFPSEQKVAMAIELERRIKAIDPRIKGVRVASYGDGSGEAAIASSVGISLQSSATSCWLSATALAADGDETQVGSGVDVGRHQGELDVAATAADAVERATRLLGARPVPSQRLTVVFDPRVASAFLAIVGGMLSGERLVKRRTPFADRLGETIAAPILTLLDDPTNPASTAADSHDGEGLASRPNLLIENGVLRTFTHNSYTARRTQTRSNACAVRGYGSTPGVGCTVLIPTPGSKSADELYADVGDGLLVQAVSGLHSGVNSVSGDFSVGVEGCLIRGGALGPPVREVTIASTLQRMLLDLRAVGGDVEWLPGGDAGVSLVIGDVALSGT